MYASDREVSTDPKKLIVESLEKSGAFGYFWDMNNIVEKVSRGNIGVNPIMGTGQQSSYMSRNVLGAIIGPTGGTLKDAAGALGGVSESIFGDSTKGFSKKDLRSVRKMLPFQNLFYMRRLLNNLEDDIGKGLPK